MAVWIKVGETSHDLKLISKVLDVLRFGNWRKEMENIV